jgi:hypothetical protein
MRCANPAVLDFQRFPSCGIIGTLHAVAVVRGGTIGSEQAVQCEIESQNLRLAEEKAIDGRSTCVINFAHVAPQLAVSTVGKNALMKNREGSLPGAN